MRHLLPAPARGRRPAPPAGPHLVPLAGEWALWRDIAVRTAGFPVSGLDIFGSKDEHAGLRAVARDPLFQTAVTWQNRAAMHNAVAKIAAGAAAPGSRQRQREEVVASYWQRYCAKNDTIGFFGLLAWGHASDDGPAIRASCGQLVSESTVHFEAWAIQALAEALDPRLTVPVGPQSERDLRTQRNSHRPRCATAGWRRSAGLSDAGQRQRTPPIQALLTRRSAILTARSRNSPAGPRPAGRARPKPPGPCSTWTACAT